MLWRSRKRRDQELERELRSHLELEAQEQQEAGLSPEDAAYAARRAFGNLTLVKERLGEIWRPTAFERFSNDLRYAARMLRKSPGFTAVAVLSIALGVGANTAIFTIVNGALLRPLPYPDADHLFSIQEKGRQFGIPTSYPDFNDWRKYNNVFSGMASYHGGDATLTGTGDPVHLLTTVHRRISYRFFG